MFFEISQNKTRRIVEKAITEIDNYFRIYKRKKSELHLDI